MWLPSVRGATASGPGSSSGLPRRLDADFGEGTAEKIEQMSNQTRKYSSEELEALIEVYNRKLRKL